MPEVGKLTDEALMTWIVNALMEAQRRGLTTVMLAEQVETDIDEGGDDGDESLHPEAGGMLH